MTDGSEHTRPRAVTQVGEYELIRRLGAGGFGAVYEARHRTTRLPCAIKRVDLSPEDAERFRNEALYPARAAAKSLHVMNVQSFFHDTSEDRFYLVTELVPHGDLRRFLDTHAKPLPLEQALEIALGIAKGLAAIHADGIVHRDLKPANVLMDHKDERWVPKITDFGLARSERSVRMGEFATSGYASPEQMDLLSEQPLGPESDMFSFGMLLYELLTGEKATSAQDLREYGQWLGSRKAPRPPSSVRPELARWPAFDALVARLLEFDRSRRTASAPEVVQLLEQLLRRVTRAEPVPEEQRDKPAPVPEPDSAVSNRRQVLGTLTGVFVATGLMSAYGELSPIFGELSDGLFSFGLPHLLVVPFGFALGLACVGGVPKAALLGVLGSGVYFIALQLFELINGSSIPLAGALLYTVPGAFGAAAMVLLTAFWRRPLLRDVHLVSAVGAVSGNAFYFGTWSESTFWMMFPVGYITWQALVGLTIVNRALFRGETTHVKDWRWQPFAAIAGVALLIAAVGAWEAAQPVPLSAGYRQTNPIDNADYSWIEPGEFQMGCSRDDHECADDERPSHAVAFTDGFWLGSTEVTVDAWRRVQGEMPPVPQFGSRVLNPDWANANMPIVNVTWSQARQYCQAVDGRLPTEAEWEYAARAGTQGARYAALPEIARYADNAGEQTLNSATLEAGTYDGRLEANGNRMHDVSGRLPNEWFLYDMIGNVAEWVEDDYADSGYASFAAASPRTNPPAHLTGIAGATKVIRGGSWYNGPYFARASSRFGMDPNAGNIHLGFRCVWNGPEE